MEVNAGASPPQLVGMGNRKKRVRMGRIGKRRWREHEQPDSQYEQPRRQYKRS